MKYRITRADAADQDLISIINYIAEESQDLRVALKYLDKLEQAIMNLSDFPYIGVAPRYKSLRTQGFKVLIIENHLAFYKVSETKKEAEVYRILHGKQDYKNMI